MADVSEEQARKAFSDFVNNRSRKLITFEGNVTAVDESKGLCDVMPNDGNAEFFDVRIVASTDNVVDGIVAIPKVGSLVLCGRFEDENNVYIQKTSELSKLILKMSDGGVIELNGNGSSLVKGEITKAELTKVTKLIEAFLQVIATPVNEPGNGAPSAFQAALSAALSALPNGDFSDILNTKVKHGQ